MSAPLGYFAIDFFVFGSDRQFSRCILSQVPSRGDLIVFKSTRYKVETIKWYLDADSEYQATISIGLTQQPFM